MSLKVFYASLVAVFASVLALSVAWEFWLEDLLLPSLVSYYETETREERWEFIATSAFFVCLSLTGFAIIGTRIIRRDAVLCQMITRQSQEDYLTGLYNRRRITELLKDELHRASRYHTTFSFILTDVDHFKAINDRLGHQAGDVVLTKIAEVIRSSVRATDYLGRWGGEEFVIISPETGIGGGHALAEKIRHCLESTHLGDIGYKTASFGVTAYAHGDELEGIISRADAGLYAAKQGGRNRVELVSAGSGVPAIHALEAKRPRPTPSAQSGDNRCRSWW